MQVNIPETIQQLLHQALKEDIGNGDHTSLATVSESKRGTALVKAKQDGVIAGVSVAELILKMIDSSIKIIILTKDGSVVRNGDIIIEAEGNVRNLLKAERLLLNCMQRMSGVATLTSIFVNEVKNTRAKILDTRKTTPNFRLFEKEAVLIGGGNNHRFGLYDMILIKDNHIDAAGGIRQALVNTKQYLTESGQMLKVEIETRNLEEVKQVLETGIASRIMLDNFEHELMRQAVGLIDDRMETEASGGITIETVRSAALTGVNYISVGALTHSYTSLDINMKIK